MPGGEQPQTVYANSFHVLSEARPPSTWMNMSCPTADPALYKGVFALPHTCSWRVAVAICMRLPSGLRRKRAWDHRNVGEILAKWIPAVKRAKTQQAAARRRLARTSSVSATNTYVLFVGRDLLGPSRPTRLQEDLGERDANLTMQKLFDSALEECRIYTWFHIDHATDPAHPYCFASSFFSGTKGVCHLASPSSAKVCFFRR